MQIKQNDVYGTGKFYVEDNGELLAELAYDMENSIMIIDHINVNDKLKGQGVGKELIRKAVEYAREKHIKINPKCPFAHKVIHETKEYQDVLAS